MAGGNRVLTPDGEPYLHVIRGIGSISDTNAETDPTLQRYATDPTLSVALTFEAG